MSQDTDKSELEHLQHEAEHVRPGGKGTVMIYLVVLFAAAFLLMLMSYFMQQRQSDAAIDSLKEAMTSMNADMRSIEELREENGALLLQIEEMNAKQTQLETEAARLQTEQALSTTEESRMQKELDALNTLNQLRSLYNKGKYAAGRDLLAACPADLEETLKAISSALSPEELEIYDPLEAYQTIVGWLTK